jgi:hypothetical protein
VQLQELGTGAGSRPPDGRLGQAQHGIQVIAVTRCSPQAMRCGNRVNGSIRLALIEPGVLNSTLPSTFPVIGDPRLNEINGLRWFLC